MNPLKVDMDAGGRQHDGVRAAALSLWLLLCPPAAAAQFSFAAFGDVPYHAGEESQLIAMIAEMNREPLAFSMHVGDLKSAHTECSDALFAQRKVAFQLSHHPFVYIPGDNEWIDCRRAHWAPRDPLERMTKLRDLFFGGDGNLGQRKMPLESQRARGYPEHLRWTIDSVVFATFNIPGPSNNAAMPGESKPRTAAVIDWMQQTFRIAREKKLAAVVLALQANLWTGNNAYAGILAAIAREALAFDGEVLVVHGDTHWHRVDRPLVDPRTGTPVGNVTRVEVFGSPFVNWVHVTVRVENGRARFAFAAGGDVAARRSR